MVIITLFSCSSEERVPEIDMSVFRNRNLPWDLSALQKVPRYSYLDSTSSVREILFEGPVHYGKKTKVFAYYSNPDILRTGKNNAKEFPGVVLISGGDQEAIREWVERWAYQGYSAINCDYGNMRKMPDGVPVSSVAFIYDSIKYGIQSVREYRSVEIAIMAHSLLLSFTEVDKQRTGVECGECAYSAKIAYPGIFFITLGSNPPGIFLFHHRLTKSRPRDVPHAVLKSFG